MGKHSKADDMSWPLSKDALRRELLLAAMTDRLGSRDQEAERLESRALGDQPQELCMRYVVSFAIYAAWRGFDDQAADALLSNYLPSTRDLLDAIIESIPGLTPEWMAGLLTCGPSYFKDGWRLVARLLAIQLKKNNLSEKDAFDFAMHIRIPVRPRI
jgi:hypothetical protein